MFVACSRTGDRSDSGSSNCSSSNSRSSSTSSSSSSNASDGLMRSLVVFPCLNAYLGTRQGNAKTTKPEEIRISDCFLGTFFRIFDAHS